MFTVEIATTERSLFIKSFDGNGVYFTEYGGCHIHETREYFLKNFNRVIGSVFIPDYDCLQSDDDQYEEIGNELNYENIVGIRFYG